jgi:hypothetical protein
MSKTLKSVKFIFSKFSLIRINYKCDMNIKDKIKKIGKFGAIGFLLIIVLITGVSCQGIFFIPGASYGYYIWQDKDKLIHIAWSVDRKQTDFGGWVATDGKIVDYKSIGFEDVDKININSDINKIEFSTSLSESDYSDEIILNVINYSYLEFELKINNGYDLERTNIGRFLNNPQNGIFRIDKGYFDNLKQVPFYKKHPWSGFFSKLSGDIGFTLFFISILGIVAIELIRITVLKRRKKHNWYLILFYGVLFVIDLGVYLFLTRFNFV